MTQHQKFCSWGQGAEIIISVGFDSILYLSECPSSVPPLWCSLEPVLETPCLKGSLPPNLNFSDKISQCWASPWSHFSWALHTKAGTPALRRCQRKDRVSVTSALVLMLLKAEPRSVMRLSPCQGACLTRLGQGSLRDAHTQLHVPSSHFCLRLWTVPFVVKKNLNIQTSQVLYFV